MKISKGALAGKILASFFMMCLIITVIPGCQKKATPSGRVVLYTSVPADIIDEIKVEFEKKQRGVQLDIFRSGSGEVMAKIYKEIDAGKIQADVIWVADFTIGEELKNAGQLLKYESPQAAQIIPQLKDKDGYYCAARLLDMIIAYNTDKVRIKPTSYRDLLNPDYKGRVGLADPSYSGASLYTVATLVQSEKHGWDYFGRLYENGIKIIKDNPSLDQAIADGELWMGISIDYLTRGRKIKYPNVPIDYVFPDEGAVLVPSPIAITKDSQNIEAAKTFVDFVLSKQGQKFMSAQGVAPVRLDVTPPSGIPTITQMRIMPSDPAKILRSKKDTTRIFAELFQGKQVEGASDTTITLYTSVPQAIIEKLRQDFEAQASGTYVRIFRKDTSAVEKKINEEIASGKIEADLIWAADSTVAEALKEKGVLLPFTPPEAAEIPDILKDKEGYYHAGGLLIMVVAYNTNTVIGKPTGYKDLLDSKYLGRIGLDTPEKSGSQIYFVGTLLQDADFGWEFFKALGKNSPQLQSSAQTTQKIASGELDLGITIDFTVRELLKENPNAPINYIYPEAGVVMVPSPIAIFKESRHLERAKVFARYMLSKKGQTLLRDLAGFVPVRLDVSPPERITSITQLRVIPTDTNWIRAHRDEMAVEFIKIFGYRKD
jgi:iron(III) transport system substrate-binding protein